MAAINIDFAVHSSPYYLKVVDLSVWGLIEPKESIIEIVVPGKGDPVTRYFDKNKLNIFNSNILGLNCEGQEGLTTLPDGIYKIKVIGSPETYNKEYYYLKTDLFDMEVDKIFIDNFDDAETKAFNDKLTEIEMLKRGAEAHLRFDMIEMACALFEKAQDLVEDLQDCATCN